MAQSDKMKATSPAENFRESLADLVTICEKLLPYCDDIAELLGMVRLALENDGQLKIIMALMQGKR